MPTGGPWIYNDDSGIIMRNEGISFCPSCPSCEGGGGGPPTICSCTFPETFDVEGIGFGSNSCSDCATIMNVRLPVTYVGAATCGGTDYQIWSSSSDVYSSPGNCSGIFDNKQMHLLVHETSCNILFKLREAASGACSGHPGASAITASASYPTAIPGGCSGAIDLTGGSFQMNWNGGAFCTNGNFTAHPFGT